MSASDVLALLVETTLASSAAMVSAERSANWPP